MRIDFLLGLLVVLDLTQAIVALLFPSIWFSAFHGVVDIDPEGLLRRAAAGWAAFAVIEAVAFLKWRRRPTWLLLVAMASPANVSAGWFFWCEGSRRIENKA